MRRPTLILAAVTTALWWQPNALSGQASPSSTTLIRNVLLLDGTGRDARPAAVRVTGDRIAEVGTLTPRTGETVVDGGGFTLAPGFIDTHSHADRALVRGNDGLGALNQGITTVVVGEDGGSPYPLAAFFDTLTRRGMPMNVAAYVGHGTVRDRVMGKDYKRHATDAEVSRMKECWRLSSSPARWGCRRGWNTTRGSTRHARRWWSWRRSPARRVAGTSRTFAARIARSGTPSTRSSRSVARRSCPCRSRTRSWR